MMMNMEKFLDELENMIKKNYEEKEYWMSDCIKRMKEGNYTSVYAFLNKLEIFDTEENTLREVLKAVANSQK